MKHRLVALTAVVAVAFTGGCGVLGNAAAGASDIASTSPARKSGPASKSDPASGSDPASKSNPARKSDPTTEATSADETPSPKKTRKTHTDAGLPDPCTLLDEAEVVDLTGREITQIDEDGVTTEDTTRYCQWQQSGGQLAVFLSRTTAEDFQITIDEAEWVDGVGEQAYTHSGHLYVLDGTIQIDVYSRGASATRNLADATAVARTLIPRV